MNLGDKCQKSDSLKRKNSENLASCGQESAPIPSAPLPQLPEGLRRSLSLSLFLSNDSARRAHTVMCFRTIRTHVVLHVIDRRFSARAGAVGGYSILTSLWTMVKLVVSVHPQGFCVASTGLAVSTQTPEVA